MRKIFFVLFDLLVFSHFADAQVPCANKEDFNYKIDLCNPLAISFTTSATAYISIKWEMDDGTTFPTTTNPSHVFTTTGNHVVKMITNKVACADTVTKIISLNVQNANVILTPDTILCAGNKRQLRTVPSLGFCWSPSTYLDNPNAAEPFTSATQSITYYYTGQITGSNLIVNGDFSQGNVGFTSAYNYATPNITEGQYFVGPNPGAWNVSLSACSGHTSGNDNMLLMNGSPVPDVNVWTQTVTVTPNTNYAFSTWVQALWPPNPALLQFSINGKEAGVLISASLPTCTWTQFFTTWNAGSNTTAVISIVNKNTAIQGNDFALDDISFAPVFAQRDSVVITVETPSVRTNNDTAVCIGKTVQLNTTGVVANFSWSPAAGLSNAGIANPVATAAAATTQYIVTGTTANGCSAKDTVIINVNQKPVISKTKDSTVCHDKTVQLNVGGGNTYAWLPAATLNNLTIANPIASPIANTTYYVTVTDNNNCSNTDSIKLAIISPGAFSVSPDTRACLGTATQLVAAGGSSYQWQPADGLDNTNIAAPLASPLVSALYSVKIKNTCADSASLSVRVNVLPLPAVQASSSNDVTCTSPSSQLTGSGALRYVWAPSAALNDSAIANPLASPALSTLFKVKGTDANGCSNYDSVTIAVTHAGDLLVNIPNAFTPNGDYRNDCFGVSRYSGFLQQVSLSVYNRFGQRIFHTTNAANCWDGRFKGKLQDAGGYVYILKASTFCGDINKKGMVMLVK